jgi:hypothetical protein
MLAERLLLSSETGGLVAQNLLYVAEVHQSCSVTRVGFDSRYPIGPQGFQVATVKGQLEQGGEVGGRRKPDFGMMPDWGT